MYTLKVLYLLSLLYCTYADYPGISQIGLGYDILKGNPYGGDFSSGNMDPGLKTNKRIVQITPIEGGEQYRELSISNYDCSDITESLIINDLASYRDELLQDIHLAGTDPDPGNMKIVAFAKSHLYTQTSSLLKSVDNVLIDNKTECAKGVVTYNDHLVEDQKFNLTREYRISVCHLPNRYDAMKYLDFLDHWGTHFVTEIIIGHKETRRFLVPIKTLIQTVSTFDSHLINETITDGKINSKLDVAGFPGSSSSEQTIGLLKKTYSIGTESNPVPIQLKLLSITETLEDKYWQDLPNDVEACKEHAYQATLILKSQNMKTALMEYKNNSQIAEPIVKTLSYAVQVEQGPGTPHATSTPLPHAQPVQWPTGTYGLPKTIHGCPSGGGDVMWSTGTLVQDTEDSGNDDGEAPNLRGLLQAWASNGHVTTEFCMKTSDTSPVFGQTWPSGSYCILKKYDCPSGFLDGYVLWDDEDSFNSNHADGELPDGTYGDHSKTKMFFCCRDDGRPDKEIVLPTEHDFVLYPKGNVCQRVKDMTVLEPWIRFDTEDTDNANQGYGVHPRFSITDSEIVVNYCYYSNPFSQSILYSPFVG